MQNDRFLKEDQEKKNTEKKGKTTEMGNVTKEEESVIHQTVRILLFTSTPSSLSYSH